VGRRGETTHKQRHPHAEDTETWPLPTSLGGREKLI